MYKREEREVVLIEAHRAVHGVHDFGAANFEALGEDIVSLTAKGDRFSSKACNGENTPRK